MTARLLRDLTAILALAGLGIGATWLLLNGYISGTHWTWAMGIAGGALVGWAWRM